MAISIFLSYPKPHLKKQETFIEALKSYLTERGFFPKTLGVTEYDMDVPLTSIRRLMLESNGIITIAFRRLYVENGTFRKNADIPGVDEKQNSGFWLTSPYSHIEPAMAYQLGLPILIVRENGVHMEGLLERGAVGIYLPEFSLDGDPKEYLKSQEWNSLIGKWEGYVRSVVDAKGKPPRLF